MNDGCYIAFGTAGPILLLDLMVQGYSKESHRVTLHRA